MIRAERDQEITQAFTVTAVALERIHQLLSTHVGSVSFSVECRDQLTRAFPTLESLLDYENSRARAIESIRISATSPDWHAKARVRLSSRDDRNIFVGLEGEESVVLTLSEALNERIAGMRPWYHRFARLKAGVILWTVLIVYSLLWPLIRWFVAWLMAGRPTVQIDQPSGVSVLVFSAGMALAAALLFLEGGLNRLRRAVFPMAVFRIGQGAARDRHSELVRQGVVIAFAVSLVAGAVLLPFS